MEIPNLIVRSGGLGVGEDGVVDSSVSEPCNEISTCSNRYLKAYAKLGEVNYA